MSINQIAEDSYRKGWEDALRLIHDLKERVIKNDVKDFKNKKGFRYYNPPKYGGGVWSPD